MVHRESTLTEGWHITQGDALECLRLMPSESVDCVVTSPPYWGLRDYGVAGQMGLEATPAEYVAGMVAVFAEVRRVLKDDGTLWLNLGDSYCTSPAGNKPGDFGASTLTNPARQDLLHHKARGGRPPSDKSTLRGNGHVGGGPKLQDLPPVRVGMGKHERIDGHLGAANRRGPDSGLKHKDLVGIPWRVAFALQEEGWYLRSDIIWHKTVPMPESVRDRPTKSHEYLFLMSKSDRYHFDQEAVRLPVSENWERGAGTPMPELGEHRLTDGARGHQVQRVYDEPKGANIRTVWSIGPQPFAGAHFAVMPTALVKPCVLAGCREGGTVLDPFAGSGTVGVVALEHGCRFHGIELNPAYVEMASKRLDQASRQGRLFHPQVGGEKARGED